MTTAPSPDPAGFQEIVACHVARYPALRIEDVYKLAHQARFGSEHAVADRAHAQQRLDQELARLGDGPTEPMLDPISPDGRILRVHLRPFVAHGGDTAQLLDAFVRTANEHRGSAAQFRSWWKDVAAMAATGHMPCTRADAQAWLCRMEAMGYPAVHHSAAYQAAYRPAYRVVAEEFLPEALRLPSPDAQPNTPPHPTR